MCINFFHFSLSAVYMNLTKMIVVYFTFAFILVLSFGRVFSRNINNVFIWIAVHIVYPINNLYSYTDVTTFTFPRVFFRIKNPKM